MENVFGKSRMELYQQANARGEKNTRDDRGPDSAINMEVDQVVYVGSERQWLGLGDDDDDDAYALGSHPRRQKEQGEGLEEQIEKELARRGYGRRRMCADSRLCTLQLITLQSPLIGLRVILVLRTRLQTQAIDGNAPGGGICMCASPVAVLIRVCGLE